MLSAIVRFVRSRQVLLMVCLGAASMAVADDLVVHEYVPHAGDSDVPNMVSGTDDSGEPAAIVYEGEVLTAPTLSPRTANERAMEAHEGTGEGREAPGRRSPTFRPDRLTTVEGSLGYFTVFNPTIAPFKRVSALDTVVDIVQGSEHVPVLGVRDPVTRPIEIVGATAPSDDERDQFWGRVVLDFTSGRTVPFPSVAPSSRVLTLRTEHPVSLQIEKDGADNFYATALDGFREEVTVVFLMDAPRTYFSVHDIPDAPADSLRDRLPSLLDAELRVQAEAFARELGISAQDPLSSVLSRLTEHFRSFEEEDGNLADAGGGIYLDLARAQKGVCRHRAYAFVITAQALGIPSRFVQNEAHAWVEVLLPETGWLRIDLGGAANALQAHSDDSDGESRPVYRPRIPDPLPQPEAYRRSYSQLRGNVSGLRQDDERPGPMSDPAPRPSVSHQDQTTARSSDPIESLFDTAPIAEPVQRRPLRLMLDERTFDVFRGRSLEVTGRTLDPEGNGAPGLRVEVLLRDANEQLLGVTVSDDDGRFRAVVGVPPDLEVGEYRLVVRSPGNAAFYRAAAN